jgi:hypothetical protein
MSSKATWRSGYAAVCKTVYPGSIPGVASNKLRVPDSRRRSSRFGGDVLRSVVLMLAALALAACSLGGRFAYVRADGQDIGDPAVSQQFNKDRMVCQAEMHVSAGTGDPHRNNDVAGGSDAVQDCMEAKGYMVVMQSEAVAKQQELAAQAAEKARREAEAAAPPPPPPPPPPPHKTKLKPKPKPAAPAAPAAAWPQPVQQPPKNSAN